MILIKTKNEFAAMIPQNPGDADKSNDPCVKALA